MSEVSLQERNNDSQTGIQREMSLKLDNILVGIVRMTPKRAKRSNSSLQKSIQATDKHKRKTSNFQKPKQKKVTFKKDFVKEIKVECWKKYLGDDTSSPRSSDFTNKKNEKNLCCVLY